MKGKDKRYYPKYTTFAWKMNMIYDENVEGTAIRPEFTPVGPFNANDYEMSIFDAIRLLDDLGLKNHLGVRESVLLCTYLDDEFASLATVISIEPRSITLKQPSSLFEIEPKLIKTFHETADYKSIIKKYVDDNYLSTVHEV